MMGRCVLLVWFIALGLGTAATAADERPQDYRTQVPLELSGEGPWYRLELPMALHLAASHGDLRDLRVFNAAGQMQAYALQSGFEQYRETRSETEVRRFPLMRDGASGEDAQLRIHRDAKGTLVQILSERAAAQELQQLRGWLLDVSAVEGSLERLILDWNAEQEGFQHFRIEASDDLQSWRDWGSGQLARMSFAGERIEQNEVSLRGLPARYLRLLWDRQAQVPQLDRARLVSIRGDSLPASVIWSPAYAPVRHTGGEYQWELPASLPLDRVRVELGETGILAPVVLSGRDDSGQQWRSLGHGLLYRLDQQGAANVQDQLQLNGQPVRHLQLKVDPRGGGLGEAPRLYAGMRAMQVIFLARGEGPYSLAVGRPGGASASLPLGTLIPGDSDSRLVQLGSAQIVSGAMAIGAARTPEADSSAQAKRYVLWALLLVGVALLVGMSLSLLRKQRDTPET